MVRIVCVRCDVVAHAQLRGPGHGSDAYVVAAAMLSRAAAMTASAVSPNSV
jgi:hypothetical protein